MSFEIFSEVLKSASDLPNFKFTFVDIVDFSPKIHYPPVLDAHIAAYILKQAKSKDLLQNKTIYEKVVTKLEKAIATITSTESM